MRAFNITSVCKDDLLSMYDETDKDDKRAINKIKRMTPDEMTYLASKLAEDYCEQLFWSSLRQIFEDRILND